MAARGSRSALGFSPIEVLTLGCSHEYSLVRAFCSGLVLSGLHDDSVEALQEEFELGYLGVFCEGLVNAVVSGQLEKNHKLMLTFSDWLSDYGFRRTDDCADRFAYIIGALCLRLVESTSHDPRIGLYGMVYQSEADRVRCECPNIATVRDALRRQGGDVGMFSQSWSQLATSLRGVAADGKGVKESLVRNLIKSIWPLGE